MVFVVIVMGLFLIEEWGFVSVGLMSSVKGLLGLLVGKGSFDSYNVKGLMYVIVVVCCYSFYHFVGYTEEVWCSIVFSGSLVFVSLLSIMSMWTMYLRGSWSYGGGSSMYQEGLSWWMMLSKFYHHISTPMVMLLRVFMNFLIGQVGKWGLVIGSASMGLVSMGGLSSLFFMYELMVVVLQSFIFVILCYEIMGLSYPVLGEFGSSKGQSSWVWIFVVGVVLVSVY